MAKPKIQERPSSAAEELPYADEVEEVLPVEKLTTKETSSAELLAGMKKFGDRVRIADQRLVEADKLLGGVESPSKTKSLSELFATEEMGTKIEPSVQGSKKSKAKTKGESEVSASGPYRSMKLEAPPKPSLREELAQEIRRRQGRLKQALAAAALALAGQASVVELASGNLSAQKSAHGVVDHHLNELEATARHILNFERGALNRFSGDVAGHQATQEDERQLERQNIELDRAEAEQREQNLDYLESGASSPEEWVQHEAETRPEFSPEVAEGMGRAEIRRLIEGGRLPNGNTLESYFSHPHDFPHDFEQHLRQHVLNRMPQAVLDDRLNSAYDGASSRLYDEAVRVAREEHEAHRPATRALALYRLMPAESIGSFQFALGEDVHDVALAADVLREDQNELRTRIISEDLPSVIRQLRRPEDAGVREALKEFLRREYNDVQELLRSGTYRLSQESMTAEDRRVNQDQLELIRRSLETLQEISR